MEVGDPMTNPVKAFEAALRNAATREVTAGGKYDKQDVHKALTLALRELGSAAGGIYYRVRGEGSERNTPRPGGINRGGMTFSPEDMRTLLKAEKQIEEAGELIASARRSIDDIDLNFSDRYDPFEDKHR
jgi:hypothetical protein